MEVTDNMFLNVGFKFVAGDVLLVDGVEREVSLSDEWLLNNMESEGKIEVLVKSLADRVNAGVQPVGDDCVVDYIMQDGYGEADKAGDLTWHTGSPWSICTWKPSLKHLEKQISDKAPLIDKQLESESNESHESEYDRGMRECVQDIANLVGLDYLATIGYSNLADAVNVALNPVVNERDNWANGDECLYCNDDVTIYTYIGAHPDGDGHYIYNDDKGIIYVANGYIREPLTPEQIAAKERENELHEIADFMNQDKSASDCEAIYNYITHKGYRK